MKKVMVVSYCTWTSLGSILQALGLKKALSKSGYESVIVLDRSSRQYGKSNKKNIKSFIEFLYKTLNHKKLVGAYSKRIDFVDQNMDVLYYGDYNELTMPTFLDPSYIYLAGSDQIWNPDQCNPMFFLDFAKDKKRISYAASMGKTIIESEKKEVFRNLLNNFDSISVREQECADVIRDLTDKEISVNIDPTFLVSAEEWRKYETPYKIGKPYILLYMLYWNKDYKKQIIALKKKTGLPVVAVCNGLSRVYADEYLLDVGVGEFLWLIDNAQYVITSSFHGVAFSAIFNKKFSAMINPALPSRITNLMRLLSIPEVHITELDGTTDFNYELINQKIQEEREKSINYLQRELTE